MNFRCITIKFFIRIDVITEVNSLLVNEVIAFEAELKYTPVKSIRNEVVSNHNKRVSIQSSPARRGTPASVLTPSGHHKLS